MQCANLADVTSPTLISAREAAAILGVSSSQLHKLARAERLPTALKGDGIRGARWFDLDDVNELASELNAERAA